MTPPRAARWLGRAGLLPQALALALLLAHDAEAHFTALAMAYAYAALILSFLGGLWWGLAAQGQAQARASVPGWVWFAAVAPSLVALATAWPWAMGEPWPGPSLGILGLALIGSLVVDYRLASAGLCPPWWLRLRIELSLGLGLLTLAIALLA